MKILVWEMRTSKGFTLMELSKKSGIGKSTINNIENGKVSPTLFQLEMIEELNQYIQELFDYWDGKNDDFEPIPIPKEVDDEMQRDSFY